MFRRPRPTHDVRVTAVTPLTSNLVRLTLFGPTLTDLGIEHPTQWVKLAVPDGHSRAYTIRHHRPVHAEADIDVVLHGNGPVSRWAAVARPGDSARLGGPRGRFQALDGAAHVVLAADESALPAALTILDRLPSSVRVSAFFEVADATDTLRLDTRADLTINWLPRPVGHPKGRLLTAALLGADLPSSASAWLAGEASSVTAIRRHLLTDRGYSGEDVQAKGYWKLGESDHKG
ncbi:siderophore-interacting protein [Kitasatospora sp. NPDC052868]|uniref:siderophore-interacting protein n=1 Tax=Kitasatospora sp. NPDC052868 TaxID=3364060 RepID=UPI0037C94CD4